MHGISISLRHCELRSSEAIQDKYNSRQDCFGLRLMSST